MTVQVTLIGNATKDPELRFTPKGDAVAVFDIAVSERVKDGDEWKDGEPTYYRVSVWKKLGEQVAEHLVKGQRCIVVGKFKPREYEAKDGTKRISLDVTAEEVALSVKWMGTQGQSRPAAQPDPWDARHDDIPPF
jgi:single-strand DNA-binding protein